MSDDLDWIARAGAKPKGRRPDFLGSPHEEKMLFILMALVAEVSVVRERMDTIERLLEEKGTISRADIEGFTPDLETGKERGRMTRAYIARIMRGVQQQMEQMAVDEPTLEEVVEELSH